MDELIRPKVAYVFSEDITSRLSLGPTLLELKKQVAEGTKSAFFDFSKSFILHSFYASDLSIFPEGDEHLISSEGCIHLKGRLDRFISAKRHLRAHAGHVHMIRHYLEGLGEFHPLRVYAYCISFDDRVRDRMSNRDLGC